VKEFTYKHVVMVRAVWHIVINVPSRQRTPKVTLKNSSSSRKWWAAWKAARAWRASRSAKRDGARRVGGLLRRQRARVELIWLSVSLEVDSNAMMLKSRATTVCAKCQPLRHSGRLQAKS